MTDPFPNWESIPTNPANDPDYCEFVIFSGSPNPDSYNFGPDEMCEEIALPGEAFCAAHLPWTE